MNTISRKFLDVAFPVAIVSEWLRIWTHPRDSIHLYILTRQCAEHPVCSLILCIFSNVIWKLHGLKFPVYAFHLVIFWCVCVFLIHKYKFPYSKKWYNWLPVLKIRRTGLDYSVHGGHLHSLSMWFCAGGVPRVSNTYLNKHSCSKSQKRKILVSVFQSLLFPAASESLKANVSWNLSLTVALPNLRMVSFLHDFQWVLWKCLRFQPAPGMCRLKRWSQQPIQLVRTKNGSILPDTLYTKVFLTV